MPEKLHVLAINHCTQVAFLTFCVAAAWLLALPFVYVLVVESVSGHEFYMMLAAVPLFMGFAGVVSYKYVQVLRGLLTQLILTPDSLRIRYGPVWEDASSREDVYPLERYIFSKRILYSNNSILLRAELEIELPEEVKSLLESACPMTDKEGGGSDICTDCELSDLCLSDVRLGCIPVPIVREEEFNVFYEKLLAAQEALRRKRQNPARPPRGNWSEINKKALEGALGSPPDSLTE